MKPFELKKVGNIADAIRLKKNNLQHFVAGGTNQVDLMKHHINMPDVLIDINSIALTTIIENNTGISIGSMVRNTAVTTHEYILTNYPLVAKAILAGASPQIRNMASVGGNILQRTRCPYFYHATAPCNKKNPGTGCSAIEGESRMAAIFGTSPQCIAVHPSDMCVAFAALDAQVHVVSGSKKTIIPFKDFHRLPGTTPQTDNNLPQNAVIESVSIPKNPYNKNFYYLKLRDRESYAFALISIAAALELSGTRIISARLAGGGVAHKPWRYTEVENYLRGKDATRAVFTHAGELAAKGAKTVEGNAFKVKMLKGAVTLALQNCLNNKM